MNATVLLITPPFTQLNTPYPATAYLKGFLQTRNISSFQCDLGIEVILEMFCNDGLEKIFAFITEKHKEGISSNARRMMALQHEYLRFINPVIQFLQGSKPTLAHLIGKRGTLPEASRFAQLDDLAWAFGSLGIHDKAKHLATLFLEDISDLVKECVDPQFGFSRYAEKIARSASTFDAIYEKLQEQHSFVDTILLQRLSRHMNTVQPQLVAFSVPFPGNLYAALRAGRWLKENYPEVKVAMGGGFPNTELRSLTDIRVFECVDFITLDDGEAPMEQLVALIQGRCTTAELKRTFIAEDGRVVYYDCSNIKDYRLEEAGTPDYGNLLPDKYISTLELANPMHRLWNDGRWNKLTMAHGCYWGKCTFCDISLSYISLYEPVAANLLCNRMEELVAQTGETGFHFVDEAAPPALMRALAIEIIRRKLVVTWWTNVRFEKSFTLQLCLLLKASGCIAVSGGLEVASDRLLKLIDKGITVSQVAKVNRNFTEAGIMVHAYLMYGFPTQTAQETIDSLEMVRQMFRLGIMQSAYWHLFTMTAHSPVGLNPAKYGVQKLTEVTGTFANNDIVHIDPAGADHESFGFGLKKSLYNYMHGLCLEDGLSKWFDFKVPRTTVPDQFIREALEETELQNTNPGSRIIWLGQDPETSIFTQSKKGNQREMMSLVFYTATGNMQIQVPVKHGQWLTGLFDKIKINNPVTLTRQQVQADYEAAGLTDFELFWDNKPMNTLYKTGLLQV